MAAMIDFWATLGVIMKKFLLVLLLFPSLAWCDGLSGRYSGKICLTSFRSNTLNSTDISRCLNIRWNISDYRTSVQIRLPSGKKVRLRRVASNTYLGVGPISTFDVNGVTCQTQDSYGAKKTRSGVTLASGNQTVCTDGDYVEFTRNGRWR